MIDTVKQRLENMNYEFSDSDDFILKFIIEKVETVIKSKCNISVIPDELKSIAVDMIIGNFLLEKKSMAIDSLIGLDLSQSIQSIREGDTSITFGNDTPEQKLNKLIDKWVHPEESVFSSYRCLKW